MTSPRLPLSSVYLDNERVGLLGDPRPRVSKVLAASGRTGGEDLEELEVLRARDPDDLEGKDALPLDEVIDRTARPFAPVYLVLARKPHRPGDRLPKQSRDSPRPRRVAFPNPGSPLPRLRGIPEPPSRREPRPYRSRAVWLGRDAGLKR